MTTDIGRFEQETAEFAVRLLERIAGYLKTSQPVRLDPYRFPRTPSVLQRFVEFLLPQREPRADTDLAKHGLAGPSTLDALGRRLDSLMPILPSVSDVYRTLCDEGSREVLLDVLCYRLLGPRHVRLPLDTHDHWARVRVLRSESRLARGTHRIPLLDGCLDRWTLSDFGMDSELYAHTLNIVSTYFLEQYAYRSTPDRITVERGDVVLDGGACWGDTTLYFAHHCGPTGHVHAFEFEPANLVVLEQNLDLSPQLSDRVTVHRCALWDRSGHELAFDSFGPGSRVEPLSDVDQSRTTSRSIDDLVESGAVDRVDFLKLDIEGAEMRALSGARETLRRFRPKLALAVYHRTEDLFEIALYIRSMDLGYRFYLDHFSTHLEETVLFAIADRSSAQDTATPSPSIE